MPGSILAEFFLQPLFELLFNVFGYWTGRIVVPVLSFGLVRIESLSRSRRVRPRWRRVHRSQNGGFVIDDEMTVLCGLLFWVAVAVVAYFVLR